MSIMPRLTRFQTQSQLINLRKGRSLIASFSLAKPKSKHWLVFLTESGADFRLGDQKQIESMVGPEIARHFNFLVINKPGLNPDGTDRDLFEQSFRRSKRIEDALITLKKVIPRSHSIHLVGYSEGAYLAPQIARKEKRVTTVSMIGGGTRGWLKEELSTASRSEKKVYQQKIENIYRNKHSLKKWNGFSYATWYSYRGDNTLQALRHLKIPTLAILGARDTVIDLRSAIVDLVLISERQPINIHILGDCGHSFSKHWPQVKLVLGRFLNDRVLNKQK